MYKFLILFVLPNFSKICIKIHPNILFPVLSLVENSFSGEFWSNYNYPYLESKL